MWSEVQPYSLKNKERTVKTYDCLPSLNDHQVLDWCRTGYAMLKPSCLKMSMHAYGILRRAQGEAPATL